MLPADLESKLTRQEVKYIRQNGDFQYSYIANMDETPIYMDMIPGKTIDKKGKKSTKVRTTKSEKCHVTAKHLSNNFINFSPDQVISDQCIFIAT